MDLQAAQQAQLESSRPIKIAFRAFEVGDVALFMQTPIANVFVAFTDNDNPSPNRYLSEASRIAALQRIKDDDERRRASRSSSRQGSGKQQQHAAVEQTVAYVVGEIVCIATHVASADYNPYSLPAGTIFYVLDAHVLHSPSAANSSSTSSSSSSGAGAGAGVGGGESGKKG